MPLACADIWMLLIWAILWLKSFMMWLLLHSQQRVVVVSPNNIISPPSFSTNMANIYSPFLFYSAFFHLFMLWWYHWTQGNRLSHDSFHRLAISSSCSVSTGMMGHEPGSSASCQEVDGCTNCNELYNNLYLNQSSIQIVRLFLILDLDAWQQSPKTYSVSILLIYLNVHVVILLLSLLGHWKC